MLLRIFFICKIRHLCLLFADNYMSIRQLFFFVIEYLKASSMSPQLKMILRHSLVFDSSEIPSTSSPTEDYPKSLLQLLFFVIKSSEISTSLLQLLLFDLKSSEASSTSPQLKNSINMKNRWYVTKIAWYSINWDPLQVCRKNKRTYYINLL